jgi:hypothetical protein
LLAFAAALGAVGVLLSIRRPCSHPIQSGIFRR